VRGWDEGRDRETKIVLALGARPIAVDLGSLFLSPQRGGSRNSGITFLE